MVAAVHGSRGMDCFFFHVKGGEEFNWRHLARKNRKKWTDLSGKTGR
jgi:hypothetical protein